MTLVTTQFALRYVSYHFEMKKTLSLYLKGPVTRHQMTNAKHVIILAFENKQTQ
jgi:hypothetical protein